MKVTTLCFPMREGIIFLAEKKQGFGAGFLNGYGGKQESDDATIQHTAVREMREEGGIIVEPEVLEKVAIVDFFEEERHLFECHVFFCREWLGEFCETEEMHAPQAYNIRNPPYRRMMDADKRWIPLVLSGKRIRGEYYYTKGMKGYRGFDFILL